MEVQHWKTFRRRNCSKTDQFRGIRLDFLFCVLGYNHEGPFEDLDRYVEA